MAVTISTVLKRPGGTKWRKAVARRHNVNKFGICKNDLGPNPISFSPDRPEEHGMSWQQRASIILPSGFTVGESWAALRKSWLGYKSALRAGEADNLKRYAYNINKVQKELGILKTDFAVMDDATFAQMDSEVTGMGFEIDKEQTIKVHEVAREIGVNERMVDYENMMHDAHDELGDMPPPRSEIFVTYHPREDKACYEEVVPPVEALHDTKGCYYEYSEQAFEKKKKKQKRLRKSCFYVTSDKTLRIADKFISLPPGVP